MKTFKQPSVMAPQQHFSASPQADTPRSGFDRSHAHKTTFDAGLLVPVFVDEVLPGDTFNLKATSFCRLATPLKPIMDNMYLDYQFWFVPARLVWENWQRFMGERVNPDDDPNDYSVPQASIDLSLVTPDSLLAYMGLPIGQTGTVSVNCLPFRAYYLIYNEWYRDQNLQDSQPVSTGDGPDILDPAAIPLRRGKRYDYFTSCLPWPQKGDPVFLPIGTTAPVLTSDSIVTGALGKPGMWFSNVADGTAPVAGTVLGFSDPFGSAPDQYSVGQYHGPVGGSGTNLGTLAPVNLFADISSATAVTINDLRSAAMIQQLLERDARGGTRYIEIILSHFGVVSPDGRLQRPELLGNATDRVNVNPIASTAPLPDAPQGNLAAVGTAVSQCAFGKSFTEHGFIIGVVSARADLTYQQGIERFWWRKTRFDYYWPSFAHLGEQAVLNREIFVTGTTTDDDVFGYQERFAEYRYKPSRISGLFASGAAASLDVWHLSQDFAALPVLNASFIEDNPPIDRIIAVPTEPHFLCDLWFDLTCIRAMPVYSVPGIGSF